MLKTVPKLVANVADVLPRILKLSLELDACSSMSPVAVVNSAL